VNLLRIQIIADHRALPQSLLFSWQMNRLKIARPIVIFSIGLLTGFGCIVFLATNKIPAGVTSVAMSPEARPVYKWYVPETPASLDFCGENVPLDRWDVRERLERELLVNYYIHGNQLQIIKLSGRYFPIIEERLKANGCPDDLKYVSVAESSLQQNALSGVGAASFWQFMKDTGPRYGLEVNEEVDERFHVVKATDAACKYFKETYEKFGTWTAAAAAYNCGPQGYLNQVTFQQAGSNYYDLIFPDETNRYVFRILALKYLLTNPKKAGNIVDPDETCKPLKGASIIVDKTIPDLAIWAKEHNSSYKMLKIYNPWLRAHRLTVKPGKQYTIVLP
jgi:membrane-bound lytic murein transglycosylase D